MPQTIKLKYVEVDARTLSITRFRQLARVPLCDDDGHQDGTISLIGTIRYKQDGVSLWVLAMQSGMVVRCPLSPELRNHDYLLKQLDFWTKHAAMPHNQKEGEESVAHREVARYKREIITEPHRFAAHSAAASLEQIFI